MLLGITGCVGVGMCAFKRGSLGRFSSLAFSLSIFFVGLTFGCFAMFYQECKGYF